MSVKAVVSLVRGVAPEPSAFITQRLAMPLVSSVSLPSSARVERKAILVPSGDQTGPTLDTLVAMSFVTGVGPEPSAFITHMLVTVAMAASAPSRTRDDSKAIRLPLGDQTGLALLVVVSLLSGV